MKRGINREGENEDNREMGMRMEREGRKEDLRIHIHK